MKLYKQCFLKHLPENLHQKGRKRCNRFYLNEEIYRRCPTHLLENPFASITLSDISLNRQGKPFKTPMSYSDDVLFNTANRVGNNVPKFQDSIVILRIRRLLKNGSFRKTLSDNRDVLIMDLKHDPLPCNYSHTVFELVLNSVVVTYSNYKETLGKKVYKRLREDCRLQIAKMIIRREIK